MVGLFLLKLIFKMDRKDLSKLIDLVIKIRPDQKDNIDKGWLVNRLINDFPSMDYELLRCYVEQKLSYYTGTILNPTIMNWASECRFRKPTAEQIQKRNEYLKPRDGYSDDTEVH